MSKRRTFIKIFVILGAILLVAGVAVFVGGMTAGGWDFSILNTVRYTQKSYDAEGAVTSVHIEYSNAAIAVEYSETAETVHIDYPVRLNERDRTRRLGKESLSMEFGQLSRRARRAPRGAEHCARPVHTKRQHFFECRRRSAPLPRPAFE